MPPTRTSHGWAGMTTCRGRPKRIGDKYNTSHENNDLRLHLVQQDTAVREVESNMRRPLSAQSTRTKGADLTKEPTRTLHLEKEELTFLALRKVSSGLDRVSIAAYVYHTNRLVCTAEHSLLAARTPERGARGATVAGARRSIDEYHTRRLVLGAELGLLGAFTAV